MSLPPGMRYMEETSDAAATMEVVPEEPGQENGIDLCEYFLPRVKRLPASNTLVHTAFSARILTCEF